MDLHKDGVALVTGAASGLGAATVKLLAGEGIRVVVLADVSEAGLKTVSAEAKSRATNPDFTAVSVIADIGSEESVLALFDQIKSQFGRLDYAVNNAGIISKHDFADFPTSEFDRVTNVNQRGLFFCMRSETKLMLQQEPFQPSAQGRARDRGTIVNVSSGAGTIGTPRNPAYVGTKHAVHGFTKTLAIDHAKDGIRVNCVAPGLMYTNIISDMKMVQERFVPKIPAQRVGDPEEIANAIIFLLSPRSSYIHGEVINVDGGYLIT